MCLHILVLCAKVCVEFIFTCLLSEVEGVLRDNKEVTGDDLDEVKYM